MMESSMLYVGNVITQYFAHVSTKVETDILDAVVRKIYRVTLLFNIVKNAFNSTVSGISLLKTDH